MATTTSTHNLKVKATDQTAGAFKSVGARAKATAASIRSVMGGAIAAAGAYLSVRAVTNTAKELGKLSDLSMKTGASVEFLTSASTAFQVAGLDISVESLAKSFQYMEKATGKTGEGAFWEAAKSIAAIEDPLKRGTELTRVFGRGGLELQPLINAGEETVRAFENVRAAMPGASQAAAEAGDSVADGMTTLGNQIKVTWGEAVGWMARALDDGFVGGTREAFLYLGAWLEVKIKSIGARIAHFLTSAANAVAGAFLTVKNYVEGVFDDRTWEEVAQDNKHIWDAVYEEQSKMDELEQDRLRRFEANFEKRKAAIAKFEENYQKLQKGLSERGGREQTPKQVGEEVGEAAVNAAKRISNELILGGSNEARKLALLGPDYQNEAKKQTQTLRSIEGILKDIREMDTDVQLASTDLGV